MWRKWMLSLRVLRRVEEEYGRQASIPDEMNPFTNIRKMKVQKLVVDQHDDHDHPSEHNMADNLRETQHHGTNGGGFILEDNEASRQPREAWTLQQDDLKSKSGSSQVVMRSLLLEDKRNHCHSDSAAAWTPGSSSEQAARSQKTQKPVKSRLQENAPQKQAPKARTSKMGRGRATNVTKRYQA